MDSTNVQFHLDNDYRWRWSLVRGDGVTLTNSDEAYFWLADAKRAVRSFLALMRGK